MLREILEKKSPTISTLKKMIKKYGGVEIIDDRELWVNITDIDDGFGYGIDQFDDDVEIDLKKDNWRLDEGFNESAFADAVKNMEFINDKIDKAIKEKDKSTLSNMDKALDEILKGL